MVELVKLDRVGLYIEVDDRVRTHPWMEDEVVVARTSNRDDRTVAV
jgi:hypothetical protein